jgi:two-component system, OmpR family, sensor kinase
VNRLSLRARLLLGVVALSAVGLTASAVVTYSSLQSFLIHRTDSSLNDAHQAVEGVFLGPAHGQGGPAPDNGHGPGPSIADLTASVPGDYVQLRRLDGSVVSGKSGFVPQFEGGASGPKPKLPSTIKLPAASRGRDRVVFFTVPAVSGDGHFRVRASIEPYEPNNILVIAAPLSSVESTLHRLLLIELLVTALVLAAIVALGLWVVRLGLKPLVAIGGTAAAIASGDLSQRVERAEPRTEIGRLGIALNAMLTQIESSLRALEASERKLRRFVADASHELRTPLAAVRAYAELFERGADTRPDDLARSMRGIERESERMSVLVDDLLLLARLDEGRPLERARVDLGTLVAEAVETAQAVEPDRPIEITTVPLVVLGDRVRLRQAIDNLLANIRAHTPVGTPVRVTLSQQGQSAIVAVSDSGPGLEPAQAAQVFERFYRADPSRTRASGGAGLGLSIVAAVAAAHGGSARAESEPGQGATFVVELPLADFSTNP